MIKAQVVYSKEHFRSLNRSLNRTRLPIAVAYEIGAILFYISLSLVLYWYFHDLHSRTWLWIVIACFAFGAYSEVRKLIKLLNIDAAADQMPVGGENRLFIFGQDEDTFTEFITDENENTRKTFRYARIHGAEENDRFFIIYIRKRLACIVGRHEFTEGTPEELSALLSRKLGSRFKVLKGGRR